MNYIKIYQNLVNKENVKIAGVSYEVHHIVPRSHGGSDDKSNLVLLTIKEHVLAHRLLAKIYPNCYKMACALRMMTTRKGIRLTTAMAAAAREAIKKNMARGYFNAVLVDGIHLCNMEKSSASHEKEEIHFGKQFATMISYHGRSMNAEACIEMYKKYPEIFYGALIGNMTVRQLYCYDDEVRVCGWVNGSDTSRSLKTLVKCL